MFILDSNIVNVISGIMDNIFAENSILGPMAMRATNKCENCSKKYDDEDQLTTFVEVENISGKKAEDILVWDAFSFIYGFSWEDFQNFKKRRSKSADSRTLTASSIAICQCCVSLLVDNYNAHLRFESSTHSLSIFQEVRSSLRKVLDKTWSLEADAFLFDLDDVTQSSPMKMGQFENYSDLDDGQHSFSSQIQTITECIKEEVIENTDDLEENHFDLEKETFQVPSEVKLEPRKLVIQVQRLSDELQRFYCDRNSSLKESCLESENASKNGGNDSTERPSLTVKAKRHKYKLLDVGVVQCRVCGQQCTSRMELRRVHMPNHHIDKSCHLCDNSDKTFYSVSSLRDHYKFIHKMGRPDELETPCPVCGKLFSSKNLIKHLKRHGPRKQYKCPNCPKVYIDKKKYDDHLLTHEQGYAGHLCRHCGKTCFNLAALNAHERLHTDAKIFKCEFCLAEFARKANLKLHMNIHTSERPFQCDECGSTYKSKNELARHLKNHKEEAENRTFECECGAVFKTSARLYMHKLRIHSNVKHECPTCGKGFRERSKLTRHERIHGKNEPNSQSKKASRNIDQLEDTGALADTPQENIV